LANFSRSYLIEAAEHSGSARSVRRRGIRFFLPQLRRSVAPDSYAGPPMLFLARSPAISISDRIPPGLQAATSWPTFAMRHLIAVHHALQTASFPNAATAVGHIEWNTRVLSSSITTMAK
jgi:hypothetical protein